MALLQCSDGGTEGALPGVHYHHLTKNASVPECSFALVSHWKPSQSVRRCKAGGLKRVVSIFVWSRIDTFSLCPIRQLVDMRWACTGFVAGQLPKCKQDQRWSARSQVSPSTKRLSHRPYGVAVYMGSIKATCSTVNTTQLLPCKIWGTATSPAVIRHQIRKSWLKHSKYSVKVHHTRSYTGTLNRKRLYAYYDERWKSSPHTLTYREGP